MTQPADKPPDDAKSSVSEPKECKELLKTLDGQDLDEKSATSSRHDEDPEKGLEEPAQPDHRGSKEHKVISFEPGDKQNPYNWSTSRKIYVVAVCVVLVINSTLGSSVSTGSSQALAEDFNITNRVQLVLPTSLYLAGYVLGPLFFAPLSESYGRWMILTSTFVLYTAFSLGSALAPNFAALNVMRLLAGIGASTPISVVGGVFADIYDNAKHRGNAMACFMVVTLTGALFGPLFSGYLSIISWRWAYWLQLILAGALWPFWLFTPETYGPTILYKRAQRLRKETGNSNIVAPIELEKRDLKTIVVVTLTRPVRMFFGEAIVLSSCIYMATVYGIFYIYLQAFSIIYGGIYGFTPGEVGITFMPIVVGTFIGCPVYLLWEGYLDKKRAESPPPEWTRKEEYSRVTLSCLAGPTMIVSIFWLAWTARPDVHWIVPVLSSIPFGLAYVLVYIGLINYLVDAYEIYAASALAAASCSRSLFGVVLPFATPSMFDTLGVAWAVSTLGFITLVLSACPFVFLKYGDRLRANSKFCQELKRLKAEKA